MLYDINWSVVSCRQLSLVVASCQLPVGSCLLVVVSGLLSVSVVCFLLPAYLQLSLVPAGRLYGWGNNDLWQVSKLLPKYYQLRH
jgi:hypothetical protein